MRSETIEPRPKVGGSARVGRVGTLVRGDAVAGVLAELDDARGGVAGEAVLRRGGVPRAASGDVAVQDAVGVHGLEVREVDVGEVGGELVEAAAEGPAAEGDHRHAALVQLGPALLGAEALELLVTAGRDPVRALDDDRHRPASGRPGR